MRPSHQESQGQKGGRFGEGETGVASMFVGWEKGNQGKR